MLDIAPYSFFIVLVFWTHRYTQPLCHPLIGLEGFEGCYYLLRVGCALLADQLFYGIALHNHPVLYHRRCIFPSFPALVVLGNGGRSP